MKIFILTYLLIGILLSLVILYSPDTKEEFNTKINEICNEDNIPKDLLVFLFVGVIIVFWPIFILAALLRSTR